MSAVSKYSNYSQFQNCNSKLNAMIAFDNSGATGQIIGSDGANGLIWVDSDPSSASFWSEYPATQTVDIADQNIENVDTIELVNIIDSSGSSGTDTQLLSRNTLGSVWIDQSDVIEKWSEYPATQTIDASGNDVENVNNLTASNIVVETQSPILLPLPNINTSLDIVVITATPIDIAPYNMTPVTSIWPVQVNSNTTNMVTGVTYYAKVFGPNQLQLNTSPDGGVPTIIDTTDLASQPQPILSLVSGYAPQTATLSDTLNITTAANTSILSSTNLTFDGVPYSRNMVNSSLIYSSAAIYADGSAPSTNLLIRNTYAYNGWYFKNTIPSSKVNWYFAPQQLNVTTVADIKGLAVSFFNGATTSNDNTLFLTIYTVPTGSGDYFPGFYHSAMTYVFDQAVTPIANTNYQGVAICDLASIPFYYETQVAYEESTVNNPKGTYLPTDKVLAVVIGSNSTSAVNSVEFVVSKLNIIMDGFTQSLQLVPP